MCVCFFYQVVEPSVVKERSVAPDEPTIKEDEEWDESEMNDKVSELNEEAISVKPKKQIVVREFKPKKEPINVIFCGHVDAGKSTIGGQIM